MRRRGGWCVDGGGDGVVNCAISKEPLKKACRLQRGTGGQISLGGQYCNHLLLAPLYSTRRHLGEDARSSDGIAKGERMWLMLRA